MANHGLIEIRSLIRDGFLVLAFTDSDVSGTPTEHVHAPERMLRKKEIASEHLTYFKIILSKERGNNARKEKYTTIDQPLIQQAYYVHRGPCVT